MTHMHFSARAEGRISYGHLGRTNSCFSPLLRRSNLRCNICAKTHCYAPAPNRRGINQCFYLTSDVCLTSVCLSVCLSWRLASLSSDTSNQDWGVCFTPHKTGNAFQGQLLILLFLILLSRFTSMIVLCVCVVAVCQPLLNYYLIWSDLICWKVGVWPTLAECQLLHCRHAVGECFKHLTQ